MRAEKRKNVGVTQTDVEAQAGKVIRGKRYKDPAYEKKRKKKREVLEIV